MRFFGSLRNQSGNTLTMVLVATAMLGIFSLIYANMMSGMNRSLQGMSEKVEIMQLQQLLMGALANAEVCSCNFDPSKNADRASALQFNSQDLSKAMIDINSIFGGCEGGKPDGELVRSTMFLDNGTVRVKSVQLKDIQSTGSGNNYRGNLIVDFDPQKMVMARKPASIPINFVADVSSPAAAKIISCSSGADFAALAPNTGGGGGGGGEPPPPKSCKTISMSVRNSKGASKDGASCTVGGCTCPEGSEAQQCHAFGTVTVITLSGPNGSEQHTPIYQSGMGTGNGRTCRWAGLRTGGTQSYSFTTNVVCCQ